MKNRSEFNKTVRFIFNSTVFSKDVCRQHVEDMLKRGYDLKQIQKEYS